MPTGRDAGMVRVRASAVRIEPGAVPNSITRSGRRNFRRGGGRRGPATPQKPLRSATPAMQSDVLDPGVPVLGKSLRQPSWRVTAPLRAPAGESRPPSGVAPGQAASAQLEFSSAGGPHRLGDGSFERVCGSPVAGGGSNPSGRGRAWAAARRAGSNPRRKPRESRSPVVPQFGVGLSPPGRSFGVRGVGAKAAARTRGRIEAPVIRGSWSFSLPVVTVGCHINDSELSLKRRGSVWRQRAPASSTGGRRCGRVSPRAPPRPSSCPASAPAAASTTSPSDCSAASGRRPR